MRELDRDERDRLKDLLPDLVNGTLPDADRHAVEARVAADPELSRDVAVLRAARAALTARATPIDIDRVVAALPAPMARSRVAVRRWRVAAAIATIAVGAASLVIVQRTFNGDSMDPFALAGAESTATGLSPAPLAISFGLGLTELADETAETILSQLEQFDGLVTIEPVARIVVPRVEGLE